MLQSLKKQIQLESSSDPIAMQMTTGTDERLKDALLDDIELSTLGAETDTTLDTIIESIPEYNEEDPEVEEELDEMMESLLSIR